MKNELYVFAEVDLRIRPTMWMVDATCVSEYASGVMLETSRANSRQSWLADFSSSAECRDWNWVRARVLEGADHMCHSFG